MSGTINYASTPNSNAATLQIGDVSRSAPLNAQTFFTPKSTDGVTNSGGSCERITLSPLGTLTATVARLFKYDGAAYHLYADEISIAALAASNGSANVAIKLEAADRPDLFPIEVPAGWSLAATINDTQVATEMAIASIAANQTTAGAQYLTLNGASVVAASAAAVAAAAAPTANTPMTLTAAPYGMTNPALVSITSAANLSAVSYKVIGRKTDGSTVTETIVGPNNTTVYSTNVYKEVMAVIPLNTNASTASIGYSTVAGTAVLSLPSKINLFSGANMSAVNFTITGTDSRGIVQTEVLAGPNVGVVTSVNTYASVLTILTSGAVASNVSVGNPAILSGVKIIAEGGGY